ncbi:O-antigen polymerase [Mesorhizobium sp. M0060]|uniref:O-antigen polymerase n=1 Tax=Mesorhizobium sp. M0060 TaxID=2956866 RepID=UPI003335429C
MNGETGFYYFIHWGFVFLALTFSWFRARNVLHPHFFLTAILCVFLSDFLVRGYDDQNISSIDVRDVFSYQLIILAIFALTIVPAAFVSNRKYEGLLEQLTAGIRMSRKVQSMILLMCTGLLLAEILKRLNSVGWSFGTVIEQSLQPRGLREWDIQSLQGNFFFSVLRSLLPFAAIGFAYIGSASKSGTVIVASFVLLLTSMAILITDGSRTPVVMVCTAFWFFWVLRYRNFAFRALLTAIVAVSVAALTSLMYLFRSFGYGTANTSEAREFAFTYHQDDSYYRALQAFHWSEISGESWNFFEFFYIILTNPIPRAIWPGKPTFDEAFWGGYKLSYVTNLYLGELVATVGIFGTVILGPVVGLLLYFMLFRSLLLLKYPMGIGAYLLVGLYVYMCMRSLANITLFLYLPAFAVLIVWFVGRRQAIAKRRWQSAHRDAMFR